MEVVSAEETAVTDLGSLLDDHDGAVVTLVAGDTRLVAHRAVLAARNLPQAYASLRDEVEAGSGQVTVADMEGPVLRQLLSSLYTLQPLEVPRPQLPEVGTMDDIWRSVCEEPPPRDVGALLDAGDGAMVTLVAGDTRLAVHRAVLAAGSPVFAAMFRHGMLEASSGRVTVTDVEGPVLRQLVAYCYSSRVPRLPDAAAELLVAADKYDMSGLKEQCKCQLAARLTVENAAATAVFGVTYSCIGLVKDAVAFIKENLTVLATQGWADAVSHRPEDAVRVSRLLGELPTEFRRCSVRRHGKEFFLLWAAEDDRMEDLRALLAEGADVMKRDARRETALHIVASRGDVAVARMLVEAGAWVNTRTADLKAPLHFAAWNGHVAMVRLLLAASADPNARDKEGRTPLHWAAARNQAEAVAALLEAGARDEIGETPLERARRRDCPQTADILAVREVPVNEGE